MKIQSTSTIFQRGDLERKVAVIVPLHNYAHVIEETLESVAAQTFHDLALIVVDDASTDHSREVAEQWMQGVDRTDLAVALFANTRNAGLSTTRNTGIAAARSEYCFFLDADNLLLPRCIAKHVEALDARPDQAGAQAIIEEFGGASGLIGTNVFHRDRLKRGNYIDAMVMMRRAVVERLGGFHPIKHGWEDYELWLRMCEQGEQLLHLPEILSRYRHHQTSMLRQQTNVGQNILDLHRTMEELHPWLQLNPPVPARAPAQASISTLMPPDKLATKPIHTRPKTGSSVDPYESYQRSIFAKLDDLSRRDHASAQIEIDIDTDYTGPVNGTQFESFNSQSHRDNSARQTRKMLRLGIVAVNPRPGVHAARGADGELIRYPSLEASDAAIRQLPSSTLIHIHAFYPDVVEEMLDCFISEAQQGRFLITTTTTKNRDAVTKIIEERGFSGAETILIENLGRDVGPFLDHAIDYASDKDVICHVHTKKSPDYGGSFGEKWRKSLYGALLTQSAVDAFADRTLGLLFPDNSRTVGWGKNRSYCERIASSFGRELAVHPGPFPIGNMFFTRVEVARAMREATRGMAWPREPVPYDGSILHAVERMWPMACEHAGFRWAAIHATHEDQARVGKK